MTPHAHQVWYIRLDGQRSMRVLADDTLHLAAEIHHAFALTPGKQVRLLVHPDTLQPTGRGAICWPDGSTYKVFTLAQAGPRMAAA